MQPALPAIAYITLNEALVAHRAMLNLTRDPGDDFYRPSLLQSALYKPLWLAKYENADLVRQATSLAVGISQNQPFVTGNKRTAFALTVAFLEKNGVEFIGDGLEMARHLERIAESRATRDEAIANFEKWLRNHVQPMH